MLVMSSDMKDDNSVISFSINFGELKKILKNYYKNNHIDVVDIKKYFVIDEDSQDIMFKIFTGKIGFVLELDQIKEILREICENNGCVFVDLEDNIILSKGRVMEFELIMQAQISKTNEYFDDETVERICGKYMEYIKELIGIDFYIKINHRINREGKLETIVKLIDADGSDNEILKWPFSKFVRFIQLSSPDVIDLVDKSILKDGEIVNNGMELSSYVVPEEFKTLKRINNKKA